MPKAEKMALFKHEHTGRYKMDNMPTEKIETATLDANDTLKNLIVSAAKEGASDIHLQEDELPRVRIQGLIKPAGSQNLPKGWIEQNIINRLDKNHQKLYHEKGNVDASLTVDQVRLRISIGGNIYGLSAAIRILPIKVPTNEELGLPTSAQNFINPGAGLIILAGATGAGKSTTMASLLAARSKKRGGQHIITLEDPIEYLQLRTGDNLITQREMHTHFENFPKGMRQALRQDPDIIVIGELRDMESARVAVGAAGSGHLVLTTIHAYDTVSCINTLLTLAGANENIQTRTQISHLLIGVIAQKLVRGSDKKRYGMFEVLVNTEDAKAAIARAALEDLDKELQMNTKAGQLQMDRHLALLVKEGILTSDEAIPYAQNPKDLMRLLAVV